ncbi:hypothetical protein GA0070616_2134 [Micromonospora nigra]|uniref:Uncharacterized protein n=1 Tax=Micromonospora nigra TaxID=145857 RepID=A0A1C6RV13_9ACTN|nr:hypothetical protein [Micromonospora nigra]SCL20899.1 hypothetical protein GA0070616_2134 [Micromonospora nigra]
MDVDVARRARGAVLTVAGLLAVAGGGSWWQANAPVPASSVDIATAGLRFVPAVPRSAVEPDGGPAGGGVPAGPHRSEVWEVDPATGETTRTGFGDEQPDAADGSGVPGARSGEVWQVDPRTGEALLADPLERTLGMARLPNTLWTERAPLTPRNEITRQVRARDGDRLLLEFRCAGRGWLTVRVEGGRTAREQHRVSCDGRVTGAEVVGAGTWVLVGLSSETAGVEVEAQLVALP